jgi:outer membrane protein assembly factor BamB
MSWKEPGGQRVGLACAGRFSAFDAGTGKLVWWSDGLSRMACAVPLCVEDTLYISSAAVQGERSNMKVPPEFEEFVKQYDKDGDGKIAATEIPSDYLFTDRQASGGAGNMNLRQAMRFFAGVDTSKPLDKEAWNQMRAGLKEFINSEWNNSNLMAVRTGGKGDVSKSNRIWQESRGVPEMASAIIYGSHIYQVRSGGLVLCRDLATGKQVYEERLSAHGGYFASPVAADGRIYAASDQGVVTVIGTGDRFAELAHNDLGEPIKATPAIVDDTVFVRSEKHLWAFNERAGK